MDRVGELCKRYTQLNDEDIAIIRAACQLLQPLANLEEADTFIDCPMPSGDAIVIAEAKPTTAESSYKKSVVGMVAKKENEPAVARTLTLGLQTRQMRCLTQENVNTIQSVESIRNGEKVIGVLIIEKKPELALWNAERLRFTEQGYETIANTMAHMFPENIWLAECIDEALLMVGTSGRVTFCNNLARELYRKLGYEEDVLGQKYSNIQLVSFKQPGEAPDGYSYKEVSVGHYVLGVKFVHLDVHDLAFAIIMRDITVLKEQEKALVLKSMAIKEMHHRVKNNLQMVASLLRLQMRRTNNRENRQALEESMNRILSIASTHQLLAKSGIDEISIMEILQDIKSSTLRYTSGARSDISISIQGDDFNVDSDIATSVALIINELLQNALKYAFQGRDTGSIEIQVSQGDLYSEISVTDNGIGFDVHADGGMGLGLSIMRTLVKDKLEGDMEIKSGSDGTSARFSFKNQTLDISSAM